VISSYEGGAKLRHEEIKIEKGMFTFLINSELMTALNLNVFVKYKEILYKSRDLLKKIIIMKYLCTKISLKGNKKHVILQSSFT
jgi:hypothetical protein